MSTQITTAFIDAFATAFQHVFQQQGSKLRNAVRNIPHRGGDAQYEDFIGAMEAVDVPTRHGDTVYQSTPHTRRKITFVTRAIADLIDREDVLATLKDPQSQYVQAFSWGMGRKLDKVLLAALGGPAYTGHEGGTTVQNYASGECRLIDGSGVLVAAGSDHSDTVQTGLTIAKLGLCMELLDDAGVPEYGRHFVANGYNKAAILQATEVGSIDYNNVKALHDGAVKEFMGFEFHWLPTSMFTVNATDVDCVECYAWQEDAVGLIIPEDQQTFIDRLPSKNQSTQVQVKMQMGATRLQGPGVIEILLKTSS